MKKSTKIVFLTSVSLALSAGVIALPFSLSLVNKNQIVFGNFQAYMAPYLLTHLSKKYNVNWEYYGTNSEIPTYIQSKTFSAQVATDNMVAELALKGKLQPIQWQRFKLWNPVTNKPVMDYWDLKGVVTEDIWYLCQQMAEQVGLEGIDGHKPSLLEYCIPYYFQCYVFAYRGPKIKQLNQSSSFLDIFKYITDKNIKNNRFLGGNSKVMMVNGPRTLYDVSKLIEAADKDTPPNQININPGWVGHKNVENWTLTRESLNKKETAPSIQSLINQYGYVYNFYKNINPNTMSLNTNSNIVLDKLARHYINGGFLYNGDAVYSAEGGDYEGDPIKNLPNYSGNDPYNEFHFIMPRENLLAMDAITIDKYTTGKTLDTIYKIANDVSLSGLPYYTEQKDTNGKITYIPHNVDYQSMGKMNKDGTYYYGSVKNFNYVNYTPCYQNLMTFVQKDYFGVVNKTNSPGMTQAEITETNNLHKIQRELITINYPPDEILGKGELPLNNLTSSNMLLAFSDFNDKI